MCIVCYCVLQLFLFQMDLDPIVHRHVPMCHVPHRHVPPTPDGVSACLIFHVTLRVEMGEMNTILPGSCGDSIEQYNRSWSIRINGLAMTSEEEKDGNLVKRKVYDHLLLPILQGAVEQGDLTDVPPVEKVLEAAHVLPARDAKTKPVIARFFIRDIRSLVFRHKKDFAPREVDVAADKPGRYVYPFFEDLTKMNFTKMRDIAAHPTVAACWSSRGQLRYKLKDSQTVKKVGCVMDTVDQILS